MIYLSLAIPVVISAFALWKFHHEIKWWELTIPFAVAIALIIGFKILGERNATKDSEIWGGWVVNARYYEDWNEYIHQTCTRTVSCGKDCTTIETYDCSYVAYYPEYWQIEDSNGQNSLISKGHYNKLVSKHGTRPRFVDMGRHYYSDDGDMYQSTWPRTEETRTDVTTEHEYENRVQASRSVFSYRKISPEAANVEGLFDYPETTLFRYPSVLGDCGPNTKLANEKLRRHNTKLGAKKQVRMWVICTDSTDPMFGQDQEAYWVGGNKNEVVLVKGQGWVHVFSWTDHKEPLIETRDFVVAMDAFDPVAAVDFMAQKIDLEFQRKHFEDFSYLTVETPTWAIWTTWGLVLLTSCGITWWNINNGYYERRR